MILKHLKLTIFIVSTFLLLVLPSYAQTAYIIFDKSFYSLSIQEGERELFTTLAGYGLPGKHPKKSSGDFLTPEGAYQVVRLNPSMQYLYFAEVDYPNLNDLSFAYFSGKITFDDLIGYFTDEKIRIKVKKILGNKIGIHGGGIFKVENGKRNFNWTQGCIAVDNDDLKKLLPYLKPGTKVFIINSSNSLFELVRKLAYPKTVKPLDFWEGGLYLYKEPITRIFFMIREEYNGKRKLIYEKWVDGRLIKRAESGPDGRLSLSLEHQLKKDLIKYIHTLEDPYLERSFEAWK